VNADERLWEELRAVGLNSIEDLTVEEALLLVKRYAVWIPVEAYVSAPWLAPFARRRIRIREDARVGGEKRDMWGFPDYRGYFSDDNSLIKAIHKGKRVIPTTSPYADSKLSGGMICCHVWPDTTKKPLLFSFVPNLVWLPKSLAPLSDNHGSDAPHPVHDYLKGVSVGRFFSQIVAVGSQRVARAWDELGSAQILPILDPSNELSDATKLVRLSTGRISRHVKFLDEVLNGSKQPSRFSKRYHAGVGKGFDPSFPPIDKAVPTPVLRELLREMGDCRE